MQMPQGTQLCSPAPAATELPLKMNLCGSGRRAIPLHSPKWCAAVQQDGMSGTLYKGGSSQVTTQRGPHTLDSELCQAPPGSSHSERPTKRIALLLVLTCGMRLPETRSMFCITCLVELPTYQGCQLFADRLRTCWPVWLSVWRQALIAVRRTTSSTDVTWDQMMMASLWSWDSQSSSCKPLTQQQNIPLHIFLPFPTQRPPPSPDVWCKV